MAQPTSPLNGDVWMWMMFLCVFLVLIVQKGNAYSFNVGGGEGNWTPSSNPNNYNEWAKRNRFQIGDTLVFVYEGEKDSVLLVAEKNYNECNTTAPLKEFNDGNTRFSLDRSGQFYFISGVRDSCKKKNEKMVVVVMADRRRRSATPPEQVHSPAPSPDAAAPPPSPPADSAKAPSQLVTPPKTDNSSSSIVAGSIRFVGALTIASSIFLAS